MLQGNPQLQYTGTHNFNIEELITLGACLRHPILDALKEF